MKVEILRQKTPRRALLNLEVAPARCLCLMHLLTFIMSLLLYALLGVMALIAFNLYLMPYTIESVNSGLVEKGDRESR